MSWTTMESSVGDETGYRIGMRGVQATLIALERYEDQNSMRQKLKDSTP